MSSASFTCIECSVESLNFPTIAELEAHVAGDHLNFCVFECEKCRYAKFPTEYTLVNHYKNDHGLTEFTIKYRYSPEVERKKVELSEKLRKCIEYRDGKSAMLPGVVKNEIPPPILPISPHQFAPSTSYTYQPYYPISSSESSEVIPKKKTQAECAICGERISNQRSSMIYHTNTRHSKFDIYECGYCHKTWNTIAKSDVLKHIKSHHEQPDGTVNLQNLTDNRRKLASRLRDEMFKCFPEKNRGKLRPLSHGTSPQQGDDDDFGLDDE